MVVVRVLAPIFFNLCLVPGLSMAKIIPLYCKEYVALTEIAVQQRDAKLAKALVLDVLGQDEFMSKPDRKIVRGMIERVYERPADGMTVHVNQTKRECKTMLKSGR